MSLEIPFLDLKKQYHSIQDEMQSAIQEVLDAQTFIMGKHVKDFENAFGDFCNSRHVIGCSSCTTALHLALMAAGGGPGDEVITTTGTFIGTTEPIYHAGAKVVLVDIDPVTCCLDPKQVEQAITDETKAIIAVHLYGRPANVQALREVIGDRNIVIIEDCAQSHGAVRDGKRCGTMGDLACFSFFPGKNLGAYGDAGCVVTDNDRYAETIRLLVNHGRKEKYEHLIEGYNYRMDALQARILSVKLKHLEAWTESRIRLATRYRRNLLELELILPEVEEDVRHVYHLYVIQTSQRDHLREFLSSQNIATGLHYPIPLHLQPCYHYLGHTKGDFPHAEKLSNNCLSLPIYPEMKEEAVDFVCENIKQCLGNR